MNPRTQQAVESLIAAERHYIALPYANRDAADAARSGLRRAEDAFWIALREEASGGRSEA